MRCENNSFQLNGAKRRGKHKQDSRDFALSELICQMEVPDGGKENREKSPGDNVRPESPYTIESLLLLDNSLLYDVEPDNGSYVPSETCEPFREPDNSVARATERQRNVATINSGVSGVASNPNEWQDKTLMNQVFAQFDSPKEIAPEDCDNISDFDTFDMFCKEDSELNVEEASLGRHKNLHESISHRDELINVSCLHITNFGDTLENSPLEKDSVKEGSPIIKTKPRILNECKIAKKKFRLNNAASKEIEDATDSTNCSSFYGLSDTAKRLIQEVKGICELYRKFAITSQV